MNEPYPKSPFTPVPVRAAMTAGPSSASAPSSRPWPRPAIVEARAAASACRVRPPTTSAAVRAACTSAGRGRRPSITRRDDEGADSPENPGIILDGGLDQIEFNARDIPPEAGDDDEPCAL